MAGTQDSGDDGQVPGLSTGGQPHAHKAAPEVLATARAQRWDPAGRIIGRAVQVAPAEEPVRAVRLDEKAARAT